MKKYSVIVFVIILFVGCTLKDSKKASFPPFKIATHSDDSTIITIPYSEFQKRYAKDLNYKKIIAQGNVNKKDLKNLASSSLIGIIEEKKLKHETNYLGINITKTEEDDFLWGNNIHEKIKTLPMFINKKTGKFDKSLVKPFVEKISQDKSSSPYFIWSYIVDEIKQELLEKKFESLIEHSFFYTSLEKSWYDKLYTGVFSIKATTIPFKNYQDAPEPSDEEYMAYLKKYGFNHKILETRYLTAATIPIKIHKHFHEKEYNSLKRQIETISNLEKIAHQNTKIKSFSSYYPENSFPQELKNLFENGEKGDVYGPYYERNSYRVVRFDKIKEIPDQAKAQHLLLKGVDYEKAQAYRTQITQRIKNGEKFLDVAKELSANNIEEAQWGDLGWFRYAEMEKEFSDSVFMGNINTYPISKTRYGWHIINIQEHKNIKKQYYFTALYWPLSPSEKDIEAAKQEAITFANSLASPDSFEEKARNNQYLIENYEAAALNTSILELDKSEPVIQWAFNSFKGDISAPYYLNEKIYLFQNKNIGAPGTIPLFAAKKLIVGEVKKTNIRKAIKKDFDFTTLNKKSIEEIAETVKSDVHTITKINFSQNTLANIGTNPYLIGLIKAAQEGEKSKILFGDENAYVFEKVSKKNVTLSTNFKKTQIKTWEINIKNNTYKEVFKLNDHLIVNNMRKQDTYFLVPKYSDTLPDNIKLNNDIFMAEIAFRNKDFKNALEGTHKFKGFAVLANAKPSKQQRLATIYAGICALQLGHYHHAITLLDGIKTNDRFFSVITKGLQGDAYAQLGNLQKAKEKYRQAVNTQSNFYINPQYIMKLAALYAKEKNIEKVVELLKLIKEKYPQNVITRNIDKYLGYYDYQLNKNNIMVE